MSFKGYKLKTGLMIIGVFFLLSFVVGSTLGQKANIYYVAIGMFIAGGLGLLNNTFTIFNDSVVKMNAKKIENFKLFANCLLFFLAIVIIINQF
jgi:hypothetical protein